MKQKELVQNLTTFRDCDYDEIEILLSEPSIGHCRTSKIIEIREGIDWDNGKIFLIPEKKLVEKTDKQTLWDIGLDFIYSIAKYDRRIYRGKARYTDLAKRAQRILDKAGYKNDWEKILNND